MAEDFEVMTIGHCPPTLIYEAKQKVVEAQQQLGVYYNPWFKPFHTTFKYLAGVRTGSGLAM